MVVDDAQNTAAKLREVAATIRSIDSDSMDVMCAALDGLDVARQKLINLCEDRDAAVMRLEEVEQSIGDAKEDLAVAAEAVERLMADNPIAKLVLTNCAYIGDINNDRAYRE